MIEQLQTKIKEEDNKVVISRAQDVQSILDYNKEKQIAGTVARSDMRHVGQIPFVVVEKWILQGSFMTDLNFNELDYNNDALATIDCTLRMDRCIQVY